MVKYLPTNRTLENLSKLRDTCVQGCKQVETDQHLKLNHLLKKL